MPALLSVSDLSAFYANRAVLHGVRLNVEEDSIVALLGANGAGKTTLLRAICGMIRTSGSIELAGRRIDGRKTEDVIRCGIAHVPEGRGTFNGFTVEENLQVAALIRRDGSVAPNLERIYAYFPRLYERRQQQAGTLSGGEQQMLAIARALLPRPRLLLLDEPSFGLSPLIVQELFGMLRRVRTEDHIAMLLVEQNVSVVFDLADYAYLIETGRIVLEGTPDDLRSADGVRRAYLGY